MIKKAIGPHVIVRKVQEKNEGLFAKTEQQLRDQRYGVGEVVKSGDEQVEEGDVVYYDTARSYKVTLDGETLTVIKVGDIILITDTDPRKQQ